MNVFTRVTWRTLMKNRVRTLVTIVGILLSTAMFTAVTTMVVSFQDYLYRSTMAVTGNWHGAVYNLPADQQALLAADGLVETVFACQDLGYAARDVEEEDSKPYLYVQAADAQWLETMPVTLIAGRLPALGYDTGNLTDVRFGGPWDAPNEFALLLAFLLPYAALRYQGWRRVLYVAVLIVMLILSWSLTGIATILLIAVVVGLKELFLRSRNALHTLTACVAGLCVLGAFGLVLYFNSDAIHAFVASKMGSIQGHLDGWDLSGLTLWNFLGLYPDMEFSEVGLIVLLRRGGVVQVLLFYGLGICCAVRAGRLAKVHRGDAVRRRLYTGMQWYLIAFLIASFNLPMMVSFSNLGVFCVFAALTARAPCPAAAVPERAGEGSTDKASV